MEATSQFAEGWYLVSWSEELGPKQVVPLRYFARDFVLYRGEDGQPRVADAFCPHLGAHLGHGGCVDGNEIVCPFHGWQFGPSGKCTNVPYAKRIPPRAAIKTYSVVEHSGMILMFYSPYDNQPNYDVPAIAELDDSAWTPLHCAHIEIETEPREIIENVADRAHFLPVHNQLVDDFEVAFEGPRATQRTTGRGHNLKGEPIPVTTEAIYHGPAVQFTRLQWAFDMVLVNAHVPIEEKKLLLRFGVTLRAGQGVELPPEVIEAHVAAARDGYFQDVAIWEHKKWRDRPVFADGDGPIGDLRKWYASFYKNTGAPLSTTS